MADNRVKIVITADGKDAKEAIQSLNKQLQSTGREAGKATRKAGKLEAAFAKTGRGVRDLSSGVFSLKGALAGLGIGIVVRDLFQAGAEAQRLQASFKAITGSATGAGREMAFIRSESERLGLSLLSTAKGYKTIAASAKGTTLEGQAVRDIFIGISEASTAMNLSSEQAEGALLALGQMISKGTVQAEELKGQLGERLPGAFQIAARAMGVSTQELNKMLEQGEILAEDLLPRLAKALHDEYGKAAMDAAHGAAQAWNRFETAVFDLKVQLGEGGFMEAATGALTDLSDVLKDEEMQKSLKGIAEGFGALTVSLGEVLPGAVDTGIGSLNKIVEWWRDLPEPLQGLLAGVAVGGKIGGKYGALFGGMAGLGFGAGAWHASEFQEQKDLAEIRTKDRAIMRGGGRRRGVALPPGTLEAEYLSQHATGGPPAPGSGGGAKGKAGWLSESKERMHLTADRFGGKLPGAARADRDKVADKAMEAMIREAEKYSEQAIKIDGRIFAQKKKRLDAEYKELKKHVQDQQALDIWYAQESSKIEKEGLDWAMGHADSYSDYIRARWFRDTGVWKDEHTKRVEFYEDVTDSLIGIGEAWGQSFKRTFDEEILETFEGGAFDMERIWETSVNSIKLKTVSAFTGMVADIAREKVVMYFRSAWDGNPNGQGTIEKMLGVDVPFLTFAGGGPVPGVWNGQRGFGGDSVPAMLTPGEYVIPRDIAQREIGLVKMLERMRGGMDVSPYAYGGPVPHMFFGGVFEGVSRLFGGLWEGVKGAAQIFGEFTSGLSDTDIGRIIALAGNVALAVATGGATIPFQLAGAGIGAGVGLATGRGIEGSLWSANTGAFVSGVGGVASKSLDGMKLAKVGDSYQWVPETATSVGYSDGAVQAIQTASPGTWDMASKAVSRMSAEAIQNIYSTGANAFDAIGKFTRQPWSTVTEYAARTGTDLGNLSYDLWRSLQDVPESVWKTLSNLPEEAIWMLRGFDLPGYAASNLPSILSHMTLSLGGLTGGDGLDKDWMRDTLGIGQEQRIGAFAHDGGSLVRSLRPDEGLIVAQDGEHVLNRKDVAELKAGLREARGRGSVGGEIHLHVTMPVHLDGREIGRHSVDFILEASTQGQHVVHVNGIRPAEI